MNNAIKVSLLAAAISVLTACSSTDNQTSPDSNKVTYQKNNKPVKRFDDNAVVNSESTPEKTTKKQTSLNLSNLNTNDALIVALDVPFKNVLHIADNVKAECNQLGKQFSNSFIKYARKYNVNALQIDKKLPNKGQVLKLTIDNVYSGGNAFIGHRKSATVSAELIVNGASIAKTSKTRNSAGGFLGGFKGSCSVLAHTVNTLGNDVAKWVKKQNVL